MKNITFYIVILLTTGWFQSEVQAQSVTCVRTAVLQDGGYEVEGTAFLEQLSDNSLQLRLSDDFFTERGPDVQIYLSDDSTSIAGGTMIVDIGPGDGISHFNGALTVPVPDNVGIDDHDYIIFRCIAFRAFWGGGSFPASSCDDSGNEEEEEEETEEETETNCQESIVATTNWVSEVSVCPNDGIADVIPLMNTIGASAGSTYAYIFADDNNLITRVVLDNTFNFEGTSLATENIFGISYEGTLSFNLGEPITSITADGCSILSSTATFLKITKVNCNPQFECVETATATTNWVTTVDICPNDGAADVVSLMNNAFIDPREGNYSYIITDDQNNVMVVHNDTSFDFEGSGPNEQRVFGISHDGPLAISIGQNLSTVSAEGCFIISDTESLFLTVTKNACAAPPANYLNITGRITVPGRGGIDGALVSLDNGMSTVTNADGVYTFNNLAAGTYTVTPSVMSGAGNGLSSTDLVLAARHILGLTRFDNIYQIISADADNSRSVSAVDLVQMRLVILGRNDSFPGNGSWRFLDIPDNLTGTTLPVNMNEFRTINLQDASVTDANFTGVKIGDLNGTANLNVR